MDNESNEGKDYYYNPVSGHSSSIVALTNPEQQLIEFENSLKGVVIDIDGNSKQVNERLVNDKGLAEIMQIARSIVNTPANMTNLDNDIISKVGTYNADTVILSLLENRQAFGIKNRSVARNIVRSINQLTILTLRRSFEEGERRFWKGSQQEITQKIIQNDQKRGILKSLLGWGK